MGVKTDPETEPDREHTAGGDFNTGKGPTSYGSAPLPILANEDVVLEMGSTAHTFTIFPRGGGADTGYSRTLPANASVLIRGRGVSKVSIDSADANAQWSKGLAGTVFPLRPNLGAGSPIVAAAKYAGATVESTSATAVSSGFGVGPVSLAKTLAVVLAQLSGGANSGTTNPKFYIYRNTTGVPAAGTAVGTDTLIATVLIGITALITGTDFPFPIEGVDASPVAGAYYYIAYSADGTNDVFLIAAASSGSAIAVVGY